MAVQFQTIRQVARQGLMSEHYLRKLVKTGNCPGIYVGTRFMVNVDLLVAQLNEASRVKPMAGGDDDG